MSIFDQIASAVASDFVTGSTVNQQYQAPQRTWVGLTDEELPALVGDNGKYMELKQVRRFYKYVEAKLKEKNT